MASACQPVVQILPHKKGLTYLTDKLPSSEAHPQCPEPPKEGARRHSHTHPHHEAHLHSVEAALLALHSA